MKAYNSYVDAVIANGSVKGVCTTGPRWDGESELAGKFSFDGLVEKLLLGSNKWVKCNPANYLESLADFRSRGLRLVKGDSYTGIDFDVTEINSKFDELMVRDPSIYDENMYILKAAAYDEGIPIQIDLDQPFSITDMDGGGFSVGYRIKTETPEEKEAFEAMIDTSPQQFESLSDSEKPNNSEWKNGDRVCSGDICGVFIGFYPDDHDLCYVIEDNIANPVLFHTNHLSKPETPEQRAERERDEAIDQMMNFTQRGVYSAIQRDLCAKLYDAGYRKETKQ